MPRCWRDDCYERSGSASKGSPSSEQLSAGPPGRISLTRESRESPAELARSPETTSSSTREARLESSGICGIHHASSPADFVVPVSQGIGRQQKGEEAQEHGEARQQAAEEGTIACGRDVAAGSAGIGIGVVDGLGDGGNCCDSNTAAVTTTRIQTNGGSFGTPVAPSSAGLTISVTGKALPEQGPQIRSLTAEVQQGGEMVGPGLDCVIDRGGRESAEPAVRLQGGSTVNREVSLGIGGPKSRYTAAEVTNVTVKSDMGVRANEDDGSFGTTVSGAGNKNAAGDESNTETLLPPPVEDGGDDEADDLTYSDLEDESLAAAPEQDTAIGGEPVISLSFSSSAIADKGRPKALASMQGDTYPLEAHGRVEVDVVDRRESHDLKSVPPYEASPRVAGGEGGELPRRSGFRVREEVEAYFVRPESGDECRDETVRIAGASGAATEIGGCRPGGAAVLGEAFSGQGAAAATMPRVTTEDGGGDSLGGVPRESCSPGRGGGGSRGAKQTNFSGPLSWSVDSSFEATPLRGEIISDVFAADTGATAASLTNAADLDGVILAARALLGEWPSEADGSKIRVDHLGRRARETVGVPGDIGRSDVESLANVSVARPHEQHLERASLAPEGSLQGTQAGSLSSRPGVLPAETGKSSRTVLDVSPEQDARGLVANDMRRKEQPRSTAIMEKILGRKVKNVTDMSTRELEEELMWIRAVLASRSHL